MIRNDIIFEILKYSDIYTIYITNKYIKVPIDSYSDSRQYGYRYVEMNLFGDFLDKYIIIKDKRVVDLIIYTYCKIMGSGLKHVLIYNDIEFYRTVIKLLCKYFRYELSIDDLNIIYINLCKQKWRNKNNSFHYIVLMGLQHGFRKIIYKKGIDYIYNLREYKYNEFKYIMELNKTSRLYRCKDIVFTVPRMLNEIHLGSINNICANDMINIFHYCTSIYKNIKFRYIEGYILFYNCGVNGKPSAISLVEWSKNIY